jgi:hypothetical protein
VLRGVDTQEKLDVHFEPLAWTARCRFAGGGAAADSVAPQSRKKGEG